jgi:hypothetical protein
VEARFFSDLGEGGMSDPKDVDDVIAYLQTPK